MVEEVDEHHFLAGSTRKNGTAISFRDARSLSAVRSKLFAPLFPLKTSQNSYAISQVYSEKDVLESSEHDMDSRQFNLLATVKGNAAKIAGFDSTRSPTVTAIGSSQFVRNHSIEKQENKNLLLRVLAYSQAQSRLVKIAKQPKQVELGLYLNSKQSVVNLILICFGYPCLVLVLGLLVLNSPYLKRKKT